MSSEWMKVMLDEIARKKGQAEQDQIEFERRRAPRDAAADATSATGATGAADAVDAREAAPDPRAAS